MKNDDAQARRDRDPDYTVAVGLSGGIVFHGHERGPEAAADRTRLAARWPAMIERIIANVEAPSVKASDFNQSP